MNPNLAQNLDPKLKETYDKIMGTQLTKSASSTPIPVPTPPQQAAVPASPTPAVPEPQKQEEEKPEMVNINATVAQAKPAAVSGKKLSPIIFIAAGVGFFLLYTFIWLKVFQVF